MRVTKTEIQPEIIEKITDMVDESVMVQDFTLSVDFALDLYALFDEEISKRGIFKGYWDLFKDVRVLFVKFKIGKLMTNVEFYSRIRKFFRYLITSKLFYELDKLDAIEALEAFLAMFKPPPPPPPPQPKQEGGDSGDSQKQDDQQGGDQDGDQDGQQNDQQDGKQDEKSKDGEKNEQDQGDNQDGEDKKNDGDDQDGEGEEDQLPKNEKNSKQKPQNQPQASKGEGGQDEGGGPGQKQQQAGEGKQQAPPKLRRNTQDKRGLSSDEGSLPIDMSKFKESLPEIEKAIEIGIFDKDDIKKYLKKHAGIEEKEVKIHNIMDIIGKIANSIEKREIDILYIARIKEVTESYRRDEVLSSVPFPDNEMTIKNIEESSELLKILPTEFLYSDDIFMQKFAKKQLQVRDYQSRRLKKQALYLLVDVSGSMQRRGIYASGVALSLVRQAVTEGSIYFLRFFDHTVKNLNRITNEQEAEKMMDILMKRPYSGGGTNIDHAIRVAIQDISEDKNKFEKAEILVITDGDDDVHVSKDDLKGIKLHSTVIEGHNSGLKNVSDTYIELKSKDFMS